MSVYRIDDKGRVVSIDGEPMVPGFFESLIEAEERVLRASAEDLQEAWSSLWGAVFRLAEDFLDEVEAVARSQKAHSERARS